MNHRWTNTIITAGASVDCAMNEPNVGVIATLITTSIPGLPFTFDEFAACRKASGEWH